MFCANDEPPPDATTDFGVIGPVIVVGAGCRERTFDGGPVVVVVGGSVEVVVVSGAAERLTAGRVLARTVPSPPPISATSAGPGCRRDDDGPGRGHEPALAQRVLPLARLGS